MAKVDVKLFGYYPEASCTTCQSFSSCGGEAHKSDDGGMKESLLSAYGDRIQVSLVNVFSPEMEQFPEVSGCLKRNGLLLPIVMVDGELRLFGSEASMKNIRQAIDAALGS